MADYKEDHEEVGRNNDEETFILIDGPPVDGKWAHAVYVSFNVYHGMDVAYMYTMSGMNGSAARMRSERGQMDVAAFRATYDKMRQDGWLTSEEAYAALNEQKAA